MIDPGDGSARPDERATKRLLGRIAGTLEVPVSTLHNPANAVGTPSPRPDDSATLADGVDDECAVLLAAYMRIVDPAERRRILMLVQAAAER